MNSSFSAKLWITNIHSHNDSSNANGQRHIDSAIKILSNLLKMN